ncbi:MAG: hypothetical protein ACTSQE_07470 [Candidatus Heimdallarchaeaceae archaeon]
MSFKRYAELKQIIKGAKEELGELERDLIEKVSEEEDSKMIKNYAIFKLTSRKVWKYTDKLTEKAKLVTEKIKLMKKEEEINGEAELVKHGESLRCTLKKD